MNEITIKQAQKIVDEWINQFEEGYWPPLSMLASLMEEVGELAREINAMEKIKRKKEIEPESDIGLEIADILLSLICLANYYKIDLESKFKEAMEKYSSRDANRWKKKGNKSLIDNK
ncbi:MAG: nucleotide pyrophosphohydrolase [Candidatus Bathyarchaeia archaeon]